MGPSPLTDYALTRARSLLTTRLAGLGATGASVTVTGSDSLAVAAVGISRDQLVRICLSPAPTVRPLIYAYDLTNVAFVPDVSIAAVPFPTSDVDPNNNWATYTDEVATLLKSSPCLKPWVKTPATETLLACDQLGDASRGYMLAPALLDPAGILGANAVLPAPGASTWTVDIDLAPKAVADLARYAAVHHGGTKAGIGTCALATTPCSNYLAVVVSGVVVPQPAALTSGQSTLQLGGALTDRDAAEMLAAELSAADLTLTPA